MRCDVAWEELSLFYCIGAIAHLYVENVSGFDTVWVTFVCIEMPRFVTFLLAILIGQRLGRTLD